ncbi:MAG: carbohydrate kinase [Chloroflexota bacterium]|nr:carbohydrate kinase [Chloroflexota bacterium]
MNKTWNLEIPPGDIDLLAVGETLVDLISLKESESLFDAIAFQKYLGGSPANIATYVAKLGGQAAVISKTGIGAFGQFLKAELRRAGVITDYLVMDHRVRTSVVFVSRTQGTPDFEAFRDADFQLEPYEVLEEAVQRAKVVHVSTFALSREPCRSAVEKTLRLARKYGKVISLDPNYSPVIWPDYREAREVLQRMLGYALISKPSLDDAQRIFGEGKKPEAYIEKFHEMGPQVVVLTMGSAGVLVSHEGRCIHIPAQRINVVDATGAGDSFWAGFLTALLDGNSLERCAFFAREVVEHKLTTVGPLRANIDKQLLYAQINAA